MGAPAFGVMGGILLLVVYVLVMAAVVVGWVMFLMAIWRGMKAHESIATSLRYMVVDSGARQQSGQ